jgi:zinc metalloprotease ZmpB
MRYAIILTVLLVGVEAWALKPTAPNPLATPLTYWDQQNTCRMEGDRVIDTRDGRVQSVGNLAEGPLFGTPEAAARMLLARHQDWVGLTKMTPQTLKAVRTAETPTGYHVTFERYIGGLPVYPGDMVVTLDKQNIARFYFSSLFVKVPDNLPTKHTLSEAAAVSVVTNYLQPKRPAYDPPQTRLVIWAGDNRDFAVCWQVWQYLDDPMGDWEVLVDANTGAIRRVIDRACYVDGTGLIFRPDPLTTARVAYGGNYADNNDASNAQLFAQEFLDTLWHITQNGSTYSLSGPYCQIIDFESPTVTPVTAANPDSFRFTRDAQGFEDVNVYYNITTSQRWIQSLGFTTIQNNPIGVDPHGLNGDDNSHYIPSSNRIAYGEGGVDDAEDADVIWHEYGHAIQTGSVPGWGAGGDERAMGEGFGDYWAGSFSRSISDYNHTWVYNWDGHNPFWDGRLLNSNYHYPQDNTSDIYRGGAIWSQACYETDLDVGRAVMNRIVLEHHFHIGTGATMLTAAQAIVAADNSLYAGAHLFQIYSHFVPRGLLTEMPTAAPFALLTPKGGDVWPIGSTVSVQWQTGGLSSNVSIELSRSGDAGPWEMLASSTANDGTEDFYMTEPRSEQCRIRLTYLGTPQRVFTSDSDFVIDQVRSLYNEDFELGGPDWAHDAGSGWNDQWNLTVGEIHSGMVAYKCGNTAASDYQDRLDARLTSPVIANLPAHAQLTFWHRIGTETIANHADSANDGGIVEVSVDGGPFLQAAMGMNSYPAYIRGATLTGPFASRTQVCSGHHVEWAQATVPLGQFTGSNIQFRFRFGSNNSAGGEGWWIDDVQLIAAGSDFAPHLPAAVPRVASLSCYPNPFNAATNIVLEIPQPARTDITVFNTLGRQVAVLYDGALPAGLHNFRFGGGEMASGMYFVQVRSGEFLRRVKLLYLR